MLVVSTGDERDSWSEYVGLCVHIKLQKVLSTLQHLRCMWLCSINCQVH